MPVKIQVIIEAVVQRCSVKKVFLEISQNSQESTCARVAFLIKLQASGLCNFIKKHLCFSVKFVKFLSTPFFHRAGLVAGSVISSKWTA